VRAAKDLHFNKNMEALKKMQAGADKLATVVGVTLGPKVRPQPGQHSSSSKCSSSMLCYAMI
jgi:chaperonin GroEL (HSP60 family)